MKLAEKYADKPAPELPLLFQRILQNCIRDYFRRQKSKSSWLSFFSSFGSKKTDEDDFDILDSMDVEEQQSISVIPDKTLQQSQTIAIIEQALENLPPRQREAFLLRYWEGMDTSETAKIMGCTEGSVKTHCSRAVRALSAFLEQQGVRLS